MGMEISLPRRSTVTTQFKVLSHFSLANLLVIARFTPKLSDLKEQILSLLWAMNLGQLAGFLCLKASPKAVVEVAARAAGISWHIILQVSLKKKKKNPADPTCGRTL